MRHPGIITFADVGVPGERLVAVNAVPRAIAFADEVPVVRIERERVGERRVTRSYGVHGELLLSTWELPRPTSPLTTLRTSP